MRKIPQITFILFVLGTFFQCTQKNNESTTENGLQSNLGIEKAKWLIGLWQNNSAEVNATEIWEKKNDSTYSGISFVIVNKDTVSYETMILEQVGKDLFYVPTVKDQNKGQAIKFLLSSASDNQLIFENKKHDFPQKISYNLITNDSILAVISGPVDGKQKSQEFPFVRKK